MTSVLRQAGSTQHDPHNKSVESILGKIVDVFVSLFNTSMN